MSRPLQHSRVALGAIAAVVGIALSAGCDSTAGNLDLASGIYGMSPTPLGQIGSLLLSAASNEVRREEATQQWANCPACRRRAWWPRQALQEHGGYARCTCGHVFVIAGYGS